MNKVQYRDISPILQSLRKFLLGRKLTPTLRFEDQVSARTQLPPVLPDGPTHKLNENYYFARDVRREVKPPTVISAIKPAIPAGSGETAAKTSLPTPGKVYHWD